MVAVAADLSATEDSVSLEEVRVIGRGGGEGERGLGHWHTLT